MWSIEPHTRAKHFILRRYLDAWLPILTISHGRVIYIDGFAGPGKYRADEDGSPIIALKAALEHRFPISSQMVFIFVEQNRNRKANLDQEIAKLTLPSNFVVYSHLGQFDQTITGLLDSVSQKRQQIAPTFAFIDPFGWSRTPFALIKRLLSNPRCEVLINLNFEELNRFFAEPSQARNLTILFGTDAWRPIASMTRRPDRRQAIHDLYQQQLMHDAQAKFVRSFEMRNRNNVTEYFLYFATNNIRGLEKMKESMWKVDPGGGFQFSDATMPDQRLLFGSEPNFDHLQKLMKQQFQSGTADIAEIEQFAVQDTGFLKAHVRPVLASMEKEQPPSIQVVASTPGRRRGTFPPGTKISFSPPSPIPKQSSLF